MPIMFKGKVYAEVHDEQPEKKPCGSDLIYRGEAIDTCSNGGDVYAHGDTIERRLREVPSAIPDIVMYKGGKWYFCFAERSTDGDSD